MSAIHAIKCLWNYPRWHMTVNVITGYLLKLTNPWKVYAAFHRLPKFGTFTEILCKLYILCPVTRQSSTIFAACAEDQSNFHRVQWRVMVCSHPFTQTLLLLLQVPSAPLPAPLILLFLPFVSSSSCPSYSPLPAPALFPFLPLLFYSSYPSYSTLPAWPSYPPLPSLLSSSSCPPILLFLLLLFSSSCPSYSTLPALLFLLNFLFLHLFLLRCSLPCSFPLLAHVSPLVHKITCFFKWSVTCHPQLHYIY